MARNVSIARARANKVAARRAYRIVVIVKVRAYLAAAMLACIGGCTLSALDGLSDGATPAGDGGGEAAASAPDADAAPSDASDAGADGGPDGDAGVDAALTSGCQGAVGCARVVFVTRAAFAVSDFGGLAGADALCNAAANGPDAIARVRNRPFRAWLSTSSTSAAARLVHGTMPYTRPGGSKAASNWSQLVSGTLSLNLDVDETGTDLPAADIAWTGTTPDGSSDDMLCTDWTTSSANELETNLAQRSHFGVR